MGNFLVLRQETKHAIMQLAQYYEDAGNLKRVVIMDFIDLIIKSSFVSCPSCDKPVFATSPTCHSCGVMVDNRPKGSFMVDILKYCTIYSPSKKKGKDWQYDRKKIRKYIPKAPKRNRKKVNV